MPPNILIIMSDEHDPACSSSYGHTAIKTPHMDALAEHGITFDAAYCNSPLCAPSRASFMTGQYVSHCEGWDNATALAEEAMTWPFLLRQNGYDVDLCGKMHLLGRDKLHGFGNQLARDPHSFLVHDMYPWKDGVKPAPELWRHVLEAGPGTTFEIEVDDEVERNALAFLKDPQRKKKPWALCVGFIAPHFPFIVPEPYFSMYFPEHADLPDLPEGHLENLPASVARMREMTGVIGYTEEQIRRARAGYYGLCTYLDDKIGVLVNELDAQGLADNTVIVHSSDHGEMLGEHGLWRKMSFYEQSVRVPLQIQFPDGLSAGKRVKENVSLIDVTATLLDLGGVSESKRDEWKMDGRTLIPLCAEASPAWVNDVICEYTAHGTDQLRGMIRRDHWKLCYTHGAPPEIELYNLNEDSGEFHNRVDDETCADLMQELLDTLLAHWKNDIEGLTETIHLSQERRRVIRDVSECGGDEAPF